MKNAKIAIGCDHAGYDLKEKIVDYLKSNNIEYKDFGTFSKDSCDYPKIAKTVAIEVAKNNSDNGLAQQFTKYGENMSVTQMCAMLLNSLWQRSQ